MCAHVNTQLRTLVSSAVGVTYVPLFCSYLCVCCILSVCMSLIILLYDDINCIQFSLDQLGSGRAVVLAHVPTQRCAVPVCVCVSQRCSACG